MPVAVPVVLVMGATGYLGPALVTAAARRGRVLAGGRDLVDVTDHAAVDALVDQVRPTAVVNAAAANPGSEPAAMARVNDSGAGAVARAAARAGARLVHVSTDVVHDGTAAPYADDAPPSPLGDYATTKAAGEVAVTAAHEGAALVRASLIWDPRRIDTPTAGFAARLAAGGAVRLWDDVLRQPVLAEDLAVLLLHLALDAPLVTGPLNAGGAQVLSRASFGRRLLAHFDVPGRAQVAVGPAPDGVPRDLRLRTTVVAGLGIRLRGVDEVLGAS